MKIGVQFLVCLIYIQLDREPSFAWIFSYEIYPIQLIFFKP